MRTMYDAVTARNIPTTAAIVAGYIDKIKLEPWSAADWARFPGAVKVQIVKKAATNAGHVLDVEPGDATPAEAPGWVRMRRAAGADPTIYMNSSTWPAVRKAFTDQGVAQPHYWVAQYDGNPKWATGWAELGCVAKQYAGNVAPGFDLSSVADYWPGVDGDDIVTPEDINAIAAKVLAGVPGAVAGVVVRNKSNGNSDPLTENLGWALRGVDVANAKLDAQTTTIGGLVQLLKQGADVDEAKLAQELAPTITAAIAAQEWTSYTPEQVAAAVKAMLHQVTGGAQ